MKQYYVDYKNAYHWCWNVIDREEKSIYKETCTAYSRRDAEKIRDALNFMEDKSTLFTKIYRLLVLNKIDAQKLIKNCDEMCKRIFKQI